VFQSVPVPASQLNGETVDRLIATRVCEVIGEPLNPLQPLRRTSARPTKVADRLDELRAGRAPLDPGNVMLGARRGHLRKTALWQSAASRWRGWGFIRQMPTGARNRAHTQFFSLP
jgi:hypothetical protein